MSDTTASSPVTWEEPPSARRPRRDWSGTAESLREKPGDWAKIDENSTSPGLTYNINNGHLKAFRPKGAFQSRSTKNPDGTYDIYAMFAGEPEAAE